MPQTVYECPECGDRKLADYGINDRQPTLWCAGESGDENHGFVIMDRNPDG